MSNTKNQKPKTKIKSKNNDKIKAIFFCENIITICLIYKNHIVLKLISVKDV